VRLTDAEIYEKFAAELVRFATGLVGPSDMGFALAGALFAAAVVGVGSAVGRKESVGG
jgi:hypothetical protein